MDSTCCCMFHNKIQLFLGFWLILLIQVFDSMHPGDTGSTLSYFSNVSFCLFRSKMSAWSVLCNKSNWISTLDAIPLVWNVTIEPVNRECWILAEKIRRLKWWETCLIRSNLHEQLNFGWFASETLVEIVACAVSQPKMPFIIRAIAEHLMVLTWAYDKQAAYIVF